MANFSQNRDRSSSSHPNPFAFKAKQDQIGQDQREVFTHFVSIPLANPVLKKNLEAFQKSLAEMRMEQLLVSPELLHLTVVMLKLDTDAKVEKAQEIFEKVSLGNQPVSIRLKGLKCMTERLEEARVLYIPVEEVGDECLMLKACHVIIDAFDKEELAAKDAKKNLKLHVTVMNSIYNKEYSKKRDTFNAREIHNKFGDENWGTYLIKEAHISKRSRVVPNSYFPRCALLPFPQE